MIDGGVGAGAIVMCNALEADRLAASVTLAVKSKPPAVVGVPETTPAPDKVKPAGRVPPADDQVYGVVPPVADNDCV